MFERELEKKEMKGTKPEAFLFYLTIVSAVSIVEDLLKLDLLSRRLSLMKELAYFLRFSFSSLAWR